MRSMTFLNVLLPLAATLLGAGITYGFNVLDRRKVAVDELFNGAIAAVALAEVANNYVGHAPRWRDATDEDYRQFLNDLRREGLRNAIQKIQRAREAIALVIPYRADLGCYLVDPSHDVVVRRAGELIAALRAGPPRSSWRRYRRSKVAAQEPSLSSAID